eukprot:869641-Rhodomonas_salina.1
MLAVSTGHRVAGAEADRGGDQHVIPHGTVSDGVCPRSPRRGHACIREVSTGLRVSRSRRIGRHQCALGQYRAHWCPIR